MAQSWLLYITQFDSHKRRPGNQLCQFYLGAGHFAERQTLTRKPFTEIPYLVSQMFLALHDLIIVLY